MKKLLDGFRSIIGRIWSLIILLRWPLTFKRYGKLFPRRQGRRLVWDEPLVFIPVLHLPWKSTWKMELVHLRFEVTDFILIGLSIWMILAVIFTPSVQQIVGMIAPIEAIRNIAYVMILVTLFDRDGGRLQTGVLVVLGLVYNWSSFQLGAVLGSLPFALGAFMILSMQFLFLPAYRFWASRGKKTLVESPARDPFDGLGTPETK